MKLLFLALGWTSLTLGVIGAFLPLLPTTPFLLLAAYCFSKGSRRLHEWLLSRPHLGPLIRDWDEHRVIRRKAKIMATLTIIPLFSYSLLYVNVSLLIKGAMALIGMTSLTFIWTRNSDATVAGAPGRSAVRCVSRGQE